MTVNILYLVIAVVGSINTVSSKQACTSGWVSLVNNCYHFSKESGSWIDGVKHCGKLNSQLLSLDSAEESFAINLQMHVTDGVKRTAYWTSGSDEYSEGQFIWMSKGKPFGYKNWCHGEPNNGHGGEHCVHLMHWEGGNTCWNDAQCPARTVYDLNTPIKFICEK